MKTRKRQCIPGTGGTKKSCSGKDIQTNACSSGMCRSTEFTRITEGKLVDFQKFQKKVIHLTFKIKTPSVYHFRLFI